MENKKIISEKKLKLTTKFILWAWVILLIFLGSLIFSAYSKLRPDSLITLLNTEIRRNYPGSDLKIDKIDYIFSIDFKLSLKSLSLTRGSQTIARANEVQLNIPWWLILLNRGSASINISDLIFFVNSSTADRLGTSAASGNSKYLKPLGMSIPKYLVDANYTIRAKNISIRELNGTRNYFTLSKLLVREFQYGKNSAFELNIPISITHKNKRYSSDLWLFGDVTPEPKYWSINYRGEFKTKETSEGFQYEDLVIDGKSTFNPMTVDLASEIELLIEKKKVGTGVISAKYNQIQVHLKFSQFPMHFLTMVGEEIKNPFWKKIQGAGEGEIKFNRSFSKEGNSSLSAKLHFPGLFTLGADHEVPGQWFLDFKNEIWETSFISPKQDLKFSRRAVLDFDKGEVTQFSQEIGFTSCDLKMALFSVQSLSGLMNPVPQPYHSTVVLLKQCLLDDKVFDGSFRFGIFPNQKYYQGELEGDKSKLLLKYVSKTNGQEFELDLVNFAWSSSYRFLDPYLSASEGILNGKMEGKWTSDWTDGIWLVKINADKLKDVSGDFFNLNQKLWDQFGMDAAGFTKRSWMGSVNKNLIKLNPLTLDSTDPAYLYGNLSSVTKAKSYLTLVYPKNKKWKAVKKEIKEVFWKKETP